MSSESDTQYSCRGPAFTSPRDATSAIREASAGRTLIEQPMTYMCAEGHWHISVRVNPYGPDETWKWLACCGEQSVDGHSPTCTTTSLLPNLSTSEGES